MQVRRGITGSKTDGLDALIRMSENVQKISQRDYIDSVVSAEAEATKQARQMLVANYNASGVKTKTGKLLGMVKRAFVEVFISKSGKVSVKLGMQSGKKKEDYIIANAVNYGRVNSRDFDVTEEKLVRNISDSGKSLQNHRVAGTKRRQNLKKALQKGSSASGVVSAGRDLSYLSRSVKTSKAGTKMVETSLGYAQVTKAFNYFKLSAAQHAKIVKTLMDGSAEYLEAKFKEALK